ncbi:MAG: CPBP family intramembrane metalloprotease [Verrucomicrobiaceae bacterium]|nr:CPBP family intramembrane metalloprotease [Verrucomicrobiaceae bacterium]
MSGAAFFQSTLCKTLVFLLGTVVLGAAFAPLLYLGGKHVVAEAWLEGTWLESVNDSMRRAHFPRYFNRAILLGALLMIWPTLRWMNAGRKRSAMRRPTGETIRRQLLLETNPLWRRHLFVGFFLAGGTLLLLGALYVNLGWYESVAPGKPLWRILLAALGTGVAVGLLEEFVFRGAFHAVLAKLLKPKTLFWVIAVFFAVIHFFNAPKSLDVEEVSYGSGFWMLGKIIGYFVSQFANPYFLIAEFAVLLAIGLVLGYTRMKTGSLWLGIGLHAGWVFGVKTLSPLTRRAFEPGEKMPWLGDNLRVGAISCLVVSLTGLVLWRWLRKKYGPPFAPREQLE